MQSSLTSHPIITLPENVVITVGDILHSPNKAIYYNQVITSNNIIQYCLDADFNMPKDFVKSIHKHNLYRFYVQAIYLEDSLISSYKYLFLIIRTLFDEEVYPLIQTEEIRSIKWYDKLY